MRRVRSYSAPMVRAGHSGISLFVQVFQSSRPPNGFNSIQSPAKALGDRPKKRPASHWTLPGNHPEAEAENEPSVPSVTIVFDQLLILHELLIMLATDTLNSLMRMWTARLFSSRTPERLLDAHRARVISLLKSRALSSNLQSLFTILIQMRAQPEKVGGGGSIPSLATTITHLNGNH